MYNHRSSSLSTSLITVINDFLCFLFSLTFHLHHVSMMFLLLSLPLLITYRWAKILQLSIHFLKDEQLSNSMSGHVLNEKN